MASLVVLACALALLTPLPALADAPGTRGEEPQPIGSAADTAEWHTVRQLPPIVAAPDSDVFTPPDDNNQWIGRRLNLGGWILDAGLGIGAGLLLTVNVVLIAALQLLSDNAPALAACGGSLNILWCTPPELFLDEAHPIGAVVRTIWRALEPIAISLVGVLFTVRIGRLVVAGPQSLAAEGKSLVLHFAMALVWIKSAGAVLGAMMRALNEFHSLVMSDALKRMLEQARDAVGTLDFALAAATLVMLVTLVALVVKALARVVQLTVLIGIAPVMGALLMDRSTSARFGQWLGKLIDVLLQQTAWVFFLWFGALFYDGVMPSSASTIEAQVGGRIVAAVIFAMALGGESILAGIAGSASAPGGVLGSALTTVVSGRFAGQVARFAWRAASTKRKPKQERETERPERPTTSADPSQSAAARRNRKAGA
jgi:hypothetical protein